jgi:hypothetical protein
VRDGRKRGAAHLVHSVGHQASRDAPKTSGLDRTMLALFGLRRLGRRVTHVPAMREVATRLPWRSAGMSGGLTSSSLLRSNRFSGHSLPVIPARYWPICKRHRHILERVGGGRMEALSGAREGEPRHLVTRPTTSRGRRRPRRRFPSMFHCGVEALPWAEGLEALRAPRERARAVNARSRCCFGRDARRGRARYREPAAPTRRSPAGGPSTR